MPGYSDDI